MTFMGTSVISLCLFFSVLFLCTYACAPLSLTHSLSFIHLVSLFSLSLFPQFLVINVYELEKKWTCHCGRLSFSILFSIFVFQVLFAFNSFQFENLALWIYTTQKRQSNMQIINNGNNGIFFSFCFNVCLNKMVWIFFSVSFSEKRRYLFFFFWLNFTYL